jgi:hypothetical protein
MIGAISITQFLQTIIVHHENVHDIEQAAISLLKKLQIQPWLWPDLTTQIWSNPAPAEF